MEGSSTPRGTLKTQQQQPTSRGSMPDVHARNRSHLGASTSSAGFGGGRGLANNAKNALPRGFRPNTAPGIGSKDTLPLVGKRKPVAYQKKLGPYRDLGGAVQVDPGYPVVSAVHPTLAVRHFQALSGAFSS